MVIQRASHGESSGVGGTPQTGPGSTGKLTTLLPLPSPPGSFPGGPGHVRPRMMGVPGPGLLDVSGSRLQIR
jgi:hypothetical protein